MPPTEVVEYLQEHNESDFPIVMSYLQEHLDKNEEAETSLHDALAFEFIREIFKLKPKDTSIDDKSFLT